MSINLDDLKKGSMPGVEADVGASLAQAAIICFEDSKHSSGVKLLVEGTFQRKPEVRWAPLANPEQARRSWDPDEATEKGATGVAVLLIDKFTEYTVVERAMKWIGTRRGSGFDYWLGKKESKSYGSQLLGEARLEVSGIRNGSHADVMARVRQKTSQTEVSDWLRIEAYVAVVEFSSPQSMVLRR